MLLFLLFLLYILIRCMYYRDSKTVIIIELSYDYHGGDFAYDNLDYIDDCSKVFF